MLFPPRPSPADEPSEMELAKTRTMRPIRNVRPRLSSRGADLGDQCGLNKLLIFISGGFANEQSRRCFGLLTLLASLLRLRRGCRGLRSGGLRLCRGPSSLGHHQQGPTSIRGATSLGRLHLGPARARAGPCNCGGDILSQLSRCCSFFCLGGCGCSCCCWCCCPIPWRSYSLQVRLSFPRPSCSSSSIPKNWPLPLLARFLPQSCHQIRARQERANEAPDTRGGQLSRPAAKPSPGQTNRTERSLQATRWTPLACQLSLDDDNNNANALGSLSFAFQLCLFLSRSCLQLAQTNLSHEPVQSESSRLLFSSTAFSSFVLFEFE